MESTVAARSADEHFGMSIKGREYLIVWLHAPCLFHTKSGYIPEASSYLLTPMLAKISLSPQTNACAVNAASTQYNWPIVLSFANEINKNHD